MDRFPSRRSTVMAPRGAVATSQPLAAQAGIRILQQGGNAVDAAVATAAVLNVVEPVSTGIGGDVFALIWHESTRSLHALNASGRAPEALSIDRLRELGHSQMPALGPLAVTVPGAVDGWWECVERFGRLAMRDTLRSAIEYAEQGFPVTPIIAHGWSRQADKLRQYNGADGGGYLMAGRAPRSGEVWRQPALGRALRLIAEEGREAYYRGPIAKSLATTVQQAGGVLTEADLAAHRSTWDAPIRIDYRGTEVVEIGPNGQGLAALIALSVTSGWDVAQSGFGSIDTLHRLIEAMKIGWADALTYVADPEFAPAPLDELLSPAYAAQRRGEVRADRAGVFKAAEFEHPGGTVYLTVVDEERNAVSFINSNYMGIGSGLVARDWGIALQNRGANFSLDPGHRNALAPGKRPYHTIIPAMAFRGGRPWLSFGVMGGFMQPQGHLQVLVNIADFGMAPQEALDAPRWSVDPVSGEVTLEAGLAHAEAGLSKLGHRVSVARPEASGQFGGGQVILIDPETEMLHAGSEPRKDGCAIGY